MKSQFNKQSAELSVLWTLLKYFTDPKFMFTFDLISSSVESSITKKKTLAKIACFFPCCSHFESKLWRTPLQQRLIRFLFPDCTVPAVPQARLNSACGTADTVSVLCLGHHRRYRRYHYGYMGIRLKRSHHQSQKQRFPDWILFQLSFNAGKTKPALQTYIFRTTTSETSLPKIFLSIKRLWKREIMVWNAKK